MSMRLECIETTSFRRGLGAVLGVLGLASCGVLPVNQGAPVVPVEPAPIHGEPPAAPAPIADPATGIPSGARLFKVGMDTLPGFAEDKLTDAWPGFLRGCERLATQATPAATAWREPCNAARALPVEEAALREFLLRRFDAYAVFTQDSKNEGLLTGYYEPILRASLTRRPPFVVPLYGPPDDLVSREQPATAGNPAARIRGRMVNGQLQPYFTRAELTPAGAPVHASLRGKEIAWVEDPVDAFFLQVQGSGKLLLQDPGPNQGKLVRIGFADMNGHPYKSIGRVLIERGELTRDNATAQSIKQWVRSNPRAGQALINENPSFIFFRLMPGTVDASVGPIGSLNVPLTEKRSVAIDPRFIPLGSLVWMSATHWGRPINQLALAQDTGSAIKGEVRADYFWGAGDAAGEEAGRTRSVLRLWLIWPK